MAQIPEKLMYKAGEVCRYTDTQPYILRFWESEFPQLAPEKTRSGQRIYRQRDIEMIVRIKKLLYEEEYTIADARKRLDEEFSSDADGRRAALEPVEDEEVPGASSAIRAVRRAREPSSASDEMENARAEIDTLRRRLAETEAARLRAEAALEETERGARVRRERALRVADRLERLAEALSPRGETGPKRAKRDSRRK